MNKCFAVGLSALLCAGIASAAETAAPAVQKQPVLATASVSTSLRIGVVDIQKVVQQSPEHK